MVTKEKRQESVNRNNVAQNKERCLLLMNLRVSIRGRLKSLRFYKENNELRGKKCFYSIYSTLSSTHTHL
jgi:hypothetical protein